MTPSKLHDVFVQKCFIHNHFFSVACFTYRKSDPQYKFSQCPYGKKCTYGNKCKFYHPERGMGPHKSITERLSEHAARHLSARNSDSNTKAACAKSLSVPLSTNTSDMNDRRKPLGMSSKPNLFFIWTALFHQDILKLKPTLFFCSI